MTTIELLKKINACKNTLAAMPEAQKNQMLLLMADSLLENQADILAANARDMELAKDVLPPVMLDRLLLREDRIAAMTQGIRAVAALPDPVGKILSENIRPNGLCIRKVRVPLGLVAIIYESRPNVTSDAAALALKSGNVCFLRPGKEAFQSAQATLFEP